MSKDQKDRPARTFIYQPIDDSRVRELARIMDDRNTWKKNWSEMFF